MRSPFFPLTLLENTSPFLEEEVIGPVFQICKVETDEQAIKMANSSRFQMATSIFSAERGKSLMDQFSSGQVYLNGVTSLTPALPYGGVGLSGYGRLGWSEGVRQFANIKTTYIS
jgi:succinate-semialdehyde dehydrogenase/glutarate-semialdehyde dehydrogenase